MKAQRTFKLKITSQHMTFYKIATNYQDAANWLSNIIFNRKKIDTANKLSKEFYSTIREKFNLSAQLTCSLFRHVVSSYKSMKANKEWHLAVYTKNTIPLCWKRDFNVNTKGLTVWGDLIYYKTRKLPIGQYCDSKLKLVKGKWYLCLTIEITIPETKNNNEILGVDRGQKNILCAVNTNKTLYIRGQELEHKRLRVRQIRAKVASVGTRSAYRLLKKLSGRGKAITQNILHVASKQLVNFAQKLNISTICFEDLTNIRKSRKIHHKQVARNNRWPYAMLEFFITYKAETVGINVEHVSAKYTSQCCPKCGHICKSNRKGLVFRCIICNYKDNADRVGGMNVARRLLLQRQAVAKRAMYQLAYSSHEGDCSSELQTKM